MREIITNAFEYTEGIQTTAGHRASALAAMENYFQKLRAEGIANRAEFASPEKMAKNPEAYREKYIAMLGKPLTEYDQYKDTPVQVLEDTFIGEDALCTMRRLRLDIGAGFETYGILCFPKNADPKEKHPFVLFQHGGSGIPEWSGVFASGNNYNYMPRRIVEKGAVVFCPLLLLWDNNDNEVHLNRQMLDNKLKQFGSSITAVEVFGHKRCLDYFSTQPYCDTEHIGMAGLSYGGFYTLMTTAADTRIRSAYASCSLFDKSDLIWIDVSEREINVPDMSWRNSGNTFLDAEIAGLVAPRAICFDVGTVDDLFGSESGVAEFARVQKFFAAHQAEDKVFLKVFEGGHETCKDDDCTEFLFKHL